MTTSYYGETAEIDLDALEGLFDEAIPRGASERAFGRRSPAAATVAAPAPRRNWGTPDSAVFAMHRRRSMRTSAPFVLADLLALALSGLIAHVLLRSAYPAAAASIHWAAPAALFPLIAAYWLRGLYSEIWVHPAIELRRLTQVNTIGLLAAAAGGLWTPPFPLWCAAAWVATTGLVPLCRAMARAYCAGRAGWGYPTLVIAASGDGDGLTRALLAAPSSGLRPVLLTDPDDNCRSSIMPVVNDSATLESILRADGIRHAVVSMPGTSTDRLSEMLDRYGGLIPHLLVFSDASTAPALWSASRGRGRLSDVGPGSGLLLPGALRAAKWMTDRIIAAAALCAGLPLLLVIALLVKGTSRGPVLFGHTRIGRNGRPFKTWKFRTMHPGGDAALREHLDRDPAARLEWERDQKLRHDPRVTRFGRFLRKSSLDEIPQLWNVLKGDMSLVGPRPIVESESKRYGRVFKLYMIVKPGLTGLWQVSGRTDAGYVARVRLDEFYIRHWSPWLDLYILAKTVVALLRRNGAY